jgi:hypothetical protein
MGYWLNCCEGTFMVIKAGKKICGADGIRTHYLLTASPIP